MQEQTRKLFYRRHIDQIIICTIYGVSRGNDILLKMNDIVEHYGKQPQANIDIFYNIEIENAQDTPENGDVPSKGSIIDYYNHEFTTKVKDIIWKTTTEGSQSLGAHPVPMSPIPLNVLKATARHGPIATPRSRKLYNPGEEGIQSNSPRAPPSATKRKVLFKG